MGVVLPSTMVLAGLGALFGVGLAVASKRFAVASDPRVDDVLESLPGANCGACGFAGCSAYAEAVVLTNASVSACTAGGQDTATAVAGIMGVTADVKEKTVAVVHCHGNAVASRFSYIGIEDCRAASLLQGGPKACEYGCLGLASCVAACPFDAIHMEDGLPVVDTDKCVACGQCVDACPRSLIDIQPLSAKVHVFCKSQDKGGVTRKACSVGCIGCKKCEKTCEFDAIHVENFLASIDYEKCTSCGNCVEACPTNAIVGAGTA